MPDTTTYPYRTIVRITDRIGGSSYQASGVLIAPDEVLTAAHVVYIQGVGTAVNITLAPGYDNGPILGTTTGTVTHYNAIANASGTLTLADVQNDFAVIHLATPLGLGYMALGADFQGGAVTVSGYPGLATQVDTPETVTRRAGYDVLVGTSLGPGSSGGPAWTNDAATPTVVGIVSASDSNGVTGYFSRITAADRATILRWVAADENDSTIAGYIDGRTGAQGSVPLQVASGGPAYLRWQYLWTSPDGVALSSSTPNVFLHGGSGQDSIQVVQGQNVLDGGAGSNFLTGGSGNDTFFTDARGASVVWNTLRNFHQGDSATLWGFDPGTSSYTWDAAEAGAAGATGATLRANIVGGHGRTGDGIDASITFAGLSVAQARSLVVTTGTQAAGNYLFFYNPGV